MNPAFNEINKQKIIENANILDIPIKMFETQIFDIVAGIDDSPCYCCMFEDIPKDNLPNYSQVGIIEWYVEL